MSTHITSQYRRPRRAGFTLIEAALTTVIVGTGVLAMVAAQQTYLQKNTWAQRTGTAVLLANELRELTLTLPPHDPVTPENMGAETGEGYVDVAGVGTFTFDDVDDFAGTISGAGFGAGRTFNPPINALQQQIDGLNGWSQFITVENVLPADIDIAVPLSNDNELMRVTVTVRYQGPNDNTASAITTLSWVIEN